MEKVVYIKWNNVMGIGNFYEEDQCYKLYIQRNGAHEEYTVLYSSPVNGEIEWLDENAKSLTDQPLPDGEYWKKRFEELMLECKEVRNYLSGLTDEYHEGQKSIYDVIIEDIEDQLKQTPAQDDLLPNLKKSTENLSKIKDKDEWLNEVRGTAQDDKQDDWISVEDRLPELSKPYYEDNNLVTPVSETCLVYDGESVFTMLYSKEGFKNPYVTHWKYLPKPPIK